MSPRLALEFLGLPQVSLNDKPIATDRRKAIALLAYLSVRDIGHTRQKYSHKVFDARFLAGLRTIQSLFQLTTINLGSSSIHRR